MYKKELLNKIVLFMIIASFLTIGSVFAEDLVVVVNKKNGIDNLSASGLKNFFMGKKSLWNDGVKVVVFDQEPLKDQFTKDFLGTTKSKYMKLWMKAMLSGKATAPKNLTSDADVIKSVAAAEGGIGYVSKSAATDDVKILKID